ncbi:hypothetical protein TPDSL_13700 [Terrisporobacter petrolearius]|uniref:hypothetical protein n=1 Tax=Terrisporobacter TaxID=1505652 RepID=UPI0008E767C8|nr:MULTISPECIES: hypothetical protein [Terrisporobacter]SFJ33801.1 hypothetical protein SAMN02910355_2282 [Terrisporobacter glycolicus]
MTHRQMEIIEKIKMLDKTKIENLAIVVDTLYMVQKKEEKGAVSNVKRSTENDCS